MKNFDITKYALLTLIYIMIVPNLNTQNLKLHQWKHRVILIITDDVDSKIYQSQIEEFTENQESFAERKLITYTILPKKIKHENEAKNQWIENSELYAVYNANHDSFKVILIGLDGGIKLEQLKVLTKSKLFSVIDAMPLRQAEIRNTP